MTPGRRGKPAPPIASGWPITTEPFAPAPAEAGGRRAQQHRLVDRRNRLLRCEPRLDARLHQDPLDDQRRQTYTTWDLTGFVRLSDLFCIHYRVDYQGKYSQRVHLSHLAADRHEMYSIESDVSKPNWEAKRATFEAILNSFSARYC